MAGADFAAAVSEHPDPAAAIGDVVGHLLERIGPAPDLALLFATADHGRALADIVSTTRALLSPAVLVGCLAESIVGNAREVEQHPGVVLWAGRTGPVAPVRLEVVPDGTGSAALVGWPGDTSTDAAAGLVLLGDPYTFPADGVLGAAHDAAPHLAVVGGMSSGSRAPGAPQLVLDGDVYSDGAVGALLGPDVEFETVVSQGCRPIGAPFVVTDSDGAVIRALAGRPPLERLAELVSASPPEERELFENGLHVGIVIDEHKASFDRGDFLVRNVLGADRSTGAIAVGQDCPVGTTVQFHVRDAATADEDLRAMLAGRRADAALLFTCNGRGRRLFTVDNHDATVATDSLGGVPVGGFFAAGEFGPVGGRSFVHGFTASLALLRRTGARTGAG
jgi:small ligand-binding sensory domain FIST